MYIYRFGTNTNITKKQEVASVITITAAQQFWRYQSDTHSPVFLLLLSLYRVVHLHITFRCYIT